ncbi:unnamed protein product [Paramecium pentaurelia]|uniref:Phosphagen kinase C-terminal domain-containing protein n=1 Tax=Paramecium pentaurelia TaxID=43138 RepID=A0A8S1UCH7_9CILI|nr:unnamed protein product [Paramecium pentaurelia]
MILVKQINHYMNYQEEQKRVDESLQNILLMVQLPHVQQIWESILGKFSNIKKGGKDEAKLKDIAKSLGLQARGVGGEHSNMDSEETVEISPSARFGVTEESVTKRLYEGLIKFYEIEKNAANEKERQNCCNTF